MSKLLHLFSNESVACEAIHLLQHRNLMRGPNLICLMFESTHYYLYFRSRHFGSSRNMNFITSLLIFLGYSFEACLFEIQSVCCLAFASFPFATILTRCAFDSMLLKRQSGQPQITFERRARTVVRNQQVQTEDTAVFKAKPRRKQSWICGTATICSTTRSDTRSCRISIIT